MKNKIFLAALAAAVLLTGCGEDEKKPSSSSSSTSSSSSSSSSSSVESSSSSSSVESSSSSSSVESSSSSSSVESSSSSSSAESSSSSSSVESSSSSSSKPVAVDPLASGESIPTENTPADTDPDDEGGVLTTSIPIPEGCTPGPYGGYYDAGGELHADPAFVPKDEYGYPIVNFWTPGGLYLVTKADKEAQLAAQREAEANKGQGFGTHTSEEDLRDFWFS